MKYMDQSKMTFDNVAFSILWVWDALLQPVVRSQRCLSAVQVTMGICVSCAQGSQAACVLGTECARTALRAVGSVAVMKASTAQPVKCVKWADTEKIVNQVITVAIETWNCHWTHPEKNELLPELYLCCGYQRTSVPGPFNLALLTQALTFP